MCRHMEVNLSKQALKEHIEQYWRSLSVIGNDEDVVISFNTRHLKSDDEDTIPLSLEIYKYKEVRTEIGT